MGFEVIIDREPTAPPRKLTVRWGMVEFKISMLDRWRWKAVGLIRKMHAALTLLENVIRPSSLLDYNLPIHSVLESQSVRDIAEKVWRPLDRTYRG